MSSGLSLAFMVVGLLAVVLAFGVVWRRTASTPADAGQLSAADRDLLTQEADHIRARAQTEATGILERARQEAEQAAQGRREVVESLCGIGQGQPVTEEHDPRLERRETPRRSRSVRRWSRA